MTVIVWAQLIAVVLLGTGAQLALKYALDRSVSGEAPRPLIRSPWVWSWFACYLLSTVLWLVVLRSVPLSQAFPILGLQFALVPIASRLLLDERMQIPQWLGVATIVIGVTLVGRG
jgi:undecaprenyl phosphate-alpha-L-ara4N flippase subunit ArnE